MIVSVTEDFNDVKCHGLAILCEATLKQDAFRRHIDRVFEGYVFSKDSRTNMAVKAILYNCMTCEGDFSYDFEDKFWMRDTTDRYAFNEAMRKFNKIASHDKRFRGRLPWIVKNIKEYFKQKLVRSYRNVKPSEEPSTEPTTAVDHQETQTPES